MFESHRFKPIDADKYLLGIMPAGYVQIAATWRTGAHKNGIVTAGHKFLETRDLLTELQIDTHVYNLIDFLIEHFDGQAE